MTDAQIVAIIGQREFETRREAGAIQKVIDARVKIAWAILDSSTPD